jgi:hypothetical protein
MNPVPELKPYFITMYFSNVLPNVTYSSGFSTTNLRDLSSLPRLLLGSRSPAARIPATQQYLLDNYEINYYAIPRPH